MEWLWLLVLGLGAGAFGVAVGTGGGIILVPLLLIFTGMEPGLVAGTSLALVAVNSFGGMLAYRKLGLIDLRSGLLFAAAGIPGSLVAPFAVESVSGGVFRLLFAFILLGLSLRMIVRPVATTTSAPRSKPLVPALATSRRVTTTAGEVYTYDFNQGLATGVNVLIGFVSAFFGGGFIRTPVLVAAFSFPVRVAVATSVFALSIYATIGAAVHATMGHVYFYPTFVWVGLGLLAGSQIGARLGATVQARWLMRVLVGLLLVMGIRLLIEAAV